MFVKSVLMKPLTKLQPNLTFLPVFKVAKQINEKATGLFNNLTK